MAIKILVIDDEPAVRQIIEIHLRSSGYDVHSVDTCAEGIQLATTKNFNLILCDIKLPDKSGIEVIKALKDKNIDVPLIVVSGFIEQSKIDEIMALGAQEYLKKPFLKEDLLDLVETTLSSNS